MVLCCGLGLDALTRSPKLTVLWSAVVELNTSAQHDRYTFGVPQDILGMLPPNPSLSSTFACALKLQPMTLWEFAMVGLVTSSPEHNT